MDIVDPAAERQRAACIYRYVPEVPEVDDLRFTGAYQDARKTRRRDGLLEGRHLRVKNRQSIRVAASAHIVCTLIWRCRQCSIGPGRAPKSAHDDFDAVVPTAEIRDQRAADLLAVHLDLFDAALHALRIPDFNLVGTFKNG